ncbi:hypothetical protein C488_12378 [Natrinema pellirubrum DSM 15624]|uniref:Uncharacterized protein n=1 Tax=Natrinema pellirubrum (strain DSM 15624 / CIP 106293 / JCM 10476 / NCIMB 786 / 157) TaxID=797303 RepID=L0JNQ3_NATP1|nr:hypothetical protein [Natrinema pellirubrum]AGB32458.1 hypothetical protein Natpe_2652 [Natrinema pellirubrum DSM 15624]ELY73598.1 hypothetical protein C488_12378 [Natrinema pellirubrum DSM 15624]
MSGIKRTGGGDRGQAYTLEGFIGSMVVLMAVLFALQSIVITPTTGGAADRTVQSQVQQETMDALSIAAEGQGQGENGTLSYMIRYWNDSEERFHGANATDSDNAYGAQSFNREAFVLGQVLSERYTETGSYYNVELVYQNDSTTNRTFERVQMVNQGSPPESAITASHTVTLYDDDELTAPGSRDKGINLSEADNYPIPPAKNGDDNPIYNVVEIRVIVW